MHISQIAHAVFNDKKTEKARSLALAGFLLHGDRTRAAHGRGHTVGVFGFGVAVGQ